MKKFKFKLQTLLNVTVALEKECKNKLALINQQLNDLKDTRQGFYDEIEETKEFYSQAMNLNDFMNANRYIERLKEKIVEINVEISIKEYDKSEAQNELIETMTRRKTYEKLREKQYFEYKKEVELEESKILDDFISSNGGEVAENYG